MEEVSKFDELLEEAYDARELHTVDEAHSEEYQNMLTDLGEAFEASPDEIVEYYRHTRVRVVAEMATAQALSRAGENINLAEKEQTAIEGHRKRAANKQRLGNFFFEIMGPDLLAEQASMAIHYSPAELEAVERNANRVESKTDSLAKVIEPQEFSESPSKDEPKPPQAEVKEGEQGLSKPEVDAAIEDLREGIIEEEIIDEEVLRKFLLASVVRVEVRNTEIELDPIQSRVLYLLFCSNKMIRGEEVKRIMQHSGLREEYNEKVSGFARFVRKTVNQVDPHKTRGIRLGEAGQARGKRYKLKDPRGNLVFTLNGDHLRGRTAQKSEQTVNGDGPVELSPDKQAELGLIKREEADTWEFDPQDSPEGNQILTLPDGTEVTLEQDEMQVLEWLHGEEPRAHSFLQRLAKGNDISTQRLNEILATLDGHEDLNVKIASKGSSKRLRYFKP